ncbi:hypothetical protein BKA67DRAFT_553928 [Truncatella angustata]|uniref:Uncharacterized protein n=1 Tax=Truncatella angustata TaxID=152316 RepID=A0A9P8URI9_9PEZI|nr:uncharacterized protein BKA67DRAFT_553928 [Truncatella angustata]KAH6656996.1 hypothetical protein BKA67DRAFT_553928 [Truncatella angustata]KAH8202729.1 hypothetical protein TruAng_003105 [Truncatella angustata]
MATTTSVTKVFLFNTDPQTLVADVLAADATATTFLLNCPSGTDSNDCGTYNETVVVGPWAKPTPPPEASTGVYDLEIKLDTEWYFHIHCDMTGTAPGVCTTTNIGGNDDGSPTATYTPESTDWNYMPVTITAGLEKLASATGSAASASASASRITSGSSTSTSAIISGTVSGTQSATAATGTSAAILGRGEPLTGTLALAGLILAWILQ